ncbi:ABC-F family ATP-binding cassette domain-containing protein [Desulfonatronovibrio magnus]|uniref:ABC-F family ATP-binding cassette domain-containing protein n=1 Tax=Desulfonatronovibrio magnus TaxID=698827 RepID=UPI000A076231|nr:ABC-F family ATP-binding cassette domain-containing protein [Desulfonatronovibrio magnus]
MKISINNISKSYSGEELFKDLTFEVNPGNRLTITGPNGCGKSTLLKMIAGLIQPDSGNISIPQGARIGYVAQDILETELDSTLLEYILSVLPDWGDFWKKWQNAISDNDNEELSRLSKVQADMEEQYGYNPEYQAEKILSGLGFEEKSFTAPLRLLSGGWRERAKLSKVLLQGADILILDEPTNHLDLEAVVWLEDYLINFSGMLVLVAHDRVFIDKIASHILHMGYDRPYFRPGNYTQFIKWHEQREMLKDKERQKLSQQINHLHSFVERFRYKATKARQAQARLAQAEKLSAKMRDFSAENKGRSLSFTWPKPRKASKVAITCADLHFTHPGKPNIFHDLNFQLFHGQKIALMGPNGSGKSTLFKLILGHLKPEQGQIHLGRNTFPAYFTQHQTDTLCLENTVLTEIRRLALENPTEEEIRSVLGLFMLDETFWNRKTASLSGGEKSRLILASLFLTKANLLMLDEPTNHLDMESREALIAALKDFPGAVFMIAHDRFLLSSVAAEVWSLDSCHIVQHGVGFDSYYESRIMDPSDEDLRDQPSAACEYKKSAESAKEKRRREAEHRNKIYNQLMPLKNEYTRQEARLEKYLGRQEELETIMALPETYQQAEKFKALSIEYQSLIEKIEFIMTDLEKLEKNISNLESQKL